MWSARAGCADRTGDRCALAEGMRRARRCIEIDDRFEDGYNALGFVYGLQHRFPEAIAALEKAVALNPLSGNAQQILNALLLLKK